MAKNIEVKARVRDLAELQKRAEALADGPAVILRQTDTFFTASSGRLKLREVPERPAQLIYYEREDKGGPKASNYFIFNTPDAGDLKDVLGRALGLKGTIRKVRRLYMVGQTRVHVDEVDGLGAFMELEVVMRDGQSETEGQRIAADLMRLLGVKESDLVETAYMDLLAGKAG